MFTIKQASQRTGVPVASLRAWERRYGVVEPLRTDSGYRMYDDRAIATLAAMRRLVDEGWSPAAAAKTILRDRSEGDDGTSRRSGESGGPGAASQPAGEDRDGPSTSPPLGFRVPRGTVGPLPTSEAADLTEEFLDAAAVVDPVAAEAVLERAFALASFEVVVDAWLMPTLHALGDAWTQGRVDVAGEHAAGHAVMRRLSQAFTSAASLARGPRVVVGLPAGALHELGSLAFATVARRRGLAVVYVGADLPRDSWLRAVSVFPTRAAVLSVPTRSDVTAARDTVEALLAARPGLVVATGGGFGEALAPGALSLPRSITEAVALLDTRTA